MVRSCAERCGRFCAALKIWKAGVTRRPLPPSHKLIMTAAGGLERVATAAVANLIHGRGRQCQNDFFLLVAFLRLLLSWPQAWRMPDYAPRRARRINQIRGASTPRTSTRLASLATTSTNSRWVGG